MNNEMTTNNTNNTAINNLAQQMAGAMADVMAQSTPGNGIGEIMGAIQSLMVMNERNVDTISELSNELSEVKTMLGKLADGGGNVPQQIEKHELSKERIAALMNVKGNLAILRKELSISDEPLIVVKRKGLEYSRFGNTVIVGVRVSFMELAKITGRTRESFENPKTIRRFYEEQGLTDNGKLSVKVGGKQSNTRRNDIMSKGKAVEYVDYIIETIDNVINE